MEISRGGRILKNENYAYDDLKRKVRVMPGRYFYHPILGKIRRAALDMVFKVFAELTDLDPEGQGSPNNK